MSHTLPPFVSIYTWPTCTLHDLALELADAKPSALPTPSVGTRLVFQLVCPDLRETSSSANSGPRFMVKDLGSMVIGEGGPGIDSDDDTGTSKLDIANGSRTLLDAHFVVGDFINCAILPPLSDGSVAPVSNAKAPPSTRPIPDSHENTYNRRARGGRREFWQGPDLRLPRGDWMRGQGTIERNGGFTNKRRHDRW